MKIGVDARLLSRELTGIGRYTLEMCRALNKLNNINLYLYSPSPIQDHIYFSIPTANFRTSVINNPFLKQAWTEVQLPYWASQDDVDVFWGPAHRLPGFLPGKVAKVVTIHDLVWKYAPETMRPMSRLLERIQMPRSVCKADMVVCDSQATFNAVKDEFHIDFDALTVVCPGSSMVVDCMPRESLHRIGIYRPFFLFVGTLEPRKNLTRLLEAYGSLQKSDRVKAMLVIAGGKGWGKEDLEGCIREMGLNDDVLMVGYVDEPTLSSLYTHALFLAMPSLYEGFGLPLVEAMAHGTPVLAANNSSMPEVVGNAGFLLDAHDIHSMSEGLKQMITNDSMRNSFATEARKNASRFNWDESAQSLRQVFEKAVSIRESSNR
jgi:glycosyltransferase involved in cell wall biosynthesis